MSKKITLSDLLLLADKQKLKTRKQFLIDLHNSNFHLVTDKSRPIEAAYHFQKKLGLSIERRDYSNTYDIKVMI